MSFLLCLPLCYVITIFFGWRSFSRFTMGLFYLFGIDGFCFGGIGVGYFVSCEDVY